MYVHMLCVIINVCQSICPASYSINIIINFRDNLKIYFNPSLPKIESGVAVGEFRDASKEFVYDHSYWSVHKTDRHFASQEQVRTNTA